MSFLLDETMFQSFSWSHLWPILLFTFITIGAIFYANKHLDDPGKSRLGFYLALIPLFFMLFRAGMVIYLGKFDHKLDLPIHLCRITAIIAPFIMLNRNRFWLGVIYFWIIVGTLNANITPDLYNGFPHFEYLCYFGLHSGLLVLPIYAVFVYKLKIVWKDVWVSFILTNVFVFVVHGFNYLLGSNYMYTMHKPEVASIVDYMGPWPWYLLTGQAIALVLMCLAIAPFIFNGIRPRSSSLNP